MVPALIKTFKLEGRLIETRVLLHRSDGWLALPYQWNAAQTEARLVLGGARINLTTPKGAVISYAIPNKNQCKEMPRQRRRRRRSVPRRAICRPNG